MMGRKRRCFRVPFEALTPTIMADKMQLAVLDPTAGMEVSYIEAQPLFVEMVSGRVLTSKDFRLKAREAEAMA